MKGRLTLFTIVASVILATLLTVAFAFPLRHVFMSAIVTPLIESFSLLCWYIHRISQVVLWSALVLAGGLVTLRMFFRAFPLPRAGGDMRYVRVRARAKSDLARITDTINRARRHPFSRQRMASELVSLAVRLIAQRERLSLKEARNRFESFTWSDDKAVPLFFSFRRQYYGVGRGKVFDRRLHEVVAFLERYHQGV